VTSLRTLHDSGVNLQVVLGELRLESDSGAIWPNSRSFELNSSLNFTDSSRAEFDHVYIVKMKLFIVWLYICLLVTTNRL
jgi:hypothetical protein